MAFFQTKGKGQSAKQNDPSPFGWKCAKILDTAIRGRARFHNRHSMKSWALVFDRLRTDGIPKSRIVDTLKWYTANIGQKFVPQAFSAATFREKFLQIEASRTRQSEDNVEAVLDDPEIRKDAEQVQLVSGDLIWPNDEKKDELKFIEISLSSYQKFLDDLFQYRAKLTRMPQDDAKPKKGIKSRPDGRKPLAAVVGGKVKLPKHPNLPKLRELDYLLSLLGPDRVEVIGRWLNLVHTAVRDWPEWSGHLLGMVWQRKNKWVRQEGRRIMQGWDADPDAWDRIIEEITQ